MTYNLVILAGVNTILFNLNPLMRFDGYYVWIDFLEMPNLYSRSRGYLVYLGKRYLLGIKNAFPPASFKEKLLLGGYGAAAFCWRIVISISLILGACTLFLGGGIILGVIALGLWMALPVLSFGKYIIQGKGVEKPKILRLVITATSLLAFLFLAGTRYIYQEKFYAPAVAIYDKEDIVRVYCPGFVRQIHVNSNQEVKQGNPVVELDNPDIHSALEQLQKDISLSKLRLNSYEEQRIELAQVERENLIYLQKQYQEKRKFADTLSLQSNINGIVQTKYLDNLKGSFVKTGTELMRVVDPGSKLLLIAIAHQDVDVFRAKLQQPIEIKIEGREQHTFTARLSYVAPKATYEIPHPALSSMGKGPLVVLQDQDRFKLASPCFIGKIHLPEELSYDLRSGEVGWIRIKGWEKPLGKYLRDTIYKWWQKLIEQYNLPF